MRLIVTRPSEDAGPLADRLRAMGHEPVMAPLVEIVPRRGAAIPEARWQAIAITSANGARALPAHHGLEAVPVFTVGAQSKAASLAAGFADVTAAGGDVARLAAHLSETLDPARGPVLYLSGSETAGDLEGLLKAENFAVVRAVLYDAVAKDRLPLSLPSFDANAAILLYSPRTARIWASLAAARPGIEQLRHLCLSANVAQALGPAYITRIAGEPTDRGMLALLNGDA
jgi:uroporphyrinogen-III synthase